MQSPCLPEWQSKSVCSARPTVNVAHRSGLRAYGVQPAWIHSGTAIANTAELKDLGAHCGALKPDIFFLRFPRQGLHPGPGINVQADWYSYLVEVIWSRVKSLRSEARVLLDMPGSLGRKFEGMGGA